MDEEFQDYLDYTAFKKIKAKGMQATIVKAQQDLSESNEGTLNSQPILTKAFGNRLADTGGLYLQCAKLDVIPAMNF